MAFCAFRTPSFVWLRACGVVSEDLPRCGLSSGLSSESKKEPSIGFGPWREQAGQRLTAAVKKGRLAVYVFAEPQALFKSRALARRSPQELGPATVPVSVLARLSTNRGSFSDHAIRPTIETAEGDEKLLGLLTVGVLVIRAGDFDVWYRSDRAKGNWPSQRSRLEIGGGRPTKQGERVRSAVIGLARWKVERQS